MKAIASIALLLALTTPILAPAQAQEVPEAQAKLVLVAPSVARVGELVRFDVSESVADSFEWRLVPQTPDFEVYAGGQRAVFSARMEGDYQFIIACAKNGTVDVIYHVLHVEGPPPMPTDDRLDEWIPFWFWAENLPKSEALALADSFEAIAGRADELEQPIDWIKATAEANREVLGDRIDAWGPLLDKIGAALRARAENGALNTPEEHAAAWLEVAAGLRKA
jgi:hypothetical protein